MTRVTAWDRRIRTALRKQKTLSCATSGSRPVSADEPTAGFCLRLAPDMSIQVESPHDYAVPPNSRRRPVLAICGSGNAGHALAVVASQNFDGDIDWLVGSEER